MSTRLYSHKVTFNTIATKTEAEIKIQEGTVVVSRSRRATSCTERQKQGRV